jgi:CheY-like chemotaxis protein
MNDFDDIDILLVEDNASDAEMTMRALKKATFVNRLCWVMDGVEALAFVRCTDDFADRDPRKPPRLILLDLKMPRLDGLDVLRELKADAATRKIPIVVMTSSNQERDITESYQLGVNGFVTKPVQLNDFASAVGKIGMYWLSINQPPSA